MDFMIRLLSVYLFATIGACSGSAESPEYASQKNSQNLTADQGIPCDEKTCNPVNIQIDGPNGSAGEAVAFSHQDNQWSFTAGSEQGPSRTYIMKLYGGPEECRGGWSGQGGGSISCSLRPNDISGSGTIKAVARDVDHCFFKYKKDPKCNDLEKPTPDDKVVEFAWRFEDGGVDMIDPAFTETPDAKFGANSGVKGCGTGILTGVISGGGAAGAAGGCVNGYVGGLKEKQDYTSQGSTASGSGNTPTQ